MPNSYASDFASLGGKARAKSLTKEERTAIAKNASTVRWEKWHREHSKK